MRISTLVLVSVVMGTAVRAEAARPDGLDCEQYPQVAAARCAQWKSTNANGRWWCHWNLDRGALDAIWGSRDPALSPGLDLTRITRDVARSDHATQTLLESYARQQIRQHESEFGLQPHGYELRLTDFMRRPAGTHPVVQADGTVLQIPVAAVSTLHLQQLVDQDPIDGATVQLQVDDNNELVSFFSTLVTDVRSPVAHHTVSSAKAKSVVLAAFASGVTLGAEDGIGVQETYAEIDGRLIPTYDVYLFLDDGPVSKHVLVDGRTAAVLSATDAVSFDDVPPGYETGVGRLFPYHPALPETSAAPDPFNTRWEDNNAMSPDTFVSELRDVQLNHLRTPHEGEDYRLAGYFCHIDDLEEPSPWTSPLPVFRGVDVFSMIIDFNPGFGEVGDINCKGSKPTDPLPTDVLPENSLWDHRLDEVEAYYHTDNAASYYDDVQHHRLGRSPYARPDIRVEVNKNTSYGTSYFANAWFPDSSYPLGVDHPRIAVDHHTCWRLIRGGVHQSFLGSGDVDYWSFVDLSRDADVLFHEFTHAIVYDVADLRGDTIYDNSYNEATASWFPTSARESSRPLNPRFDEWSLGDQEAMDPKDSSGTDIDRVYPDDFDPSPQAEPHANGRIWAQTLWDLRDRAAIWEAELPNRGITAHSIERLDFEALTRLGHHVGACGFSHPLETLLDADAALTGSVLDYDILASGARHGVKLSWCDTGEVSVAEPQDYVVDLSAGKDLLFTVYGGSNNAFRFQYATDPQLIRSTPNPPPPLSAGYGETICEPPACPMSALPRSVEQPDQNLFGTVTLGNADLQTLAGGSKDPVALFYRVTTYHVASDGTVTHSLISDRPGAGASYRDPDLPAIILQQSGTTSCQCGILDGTSPIGTGIAFLGALGLTTTLARRRRYM